MTNKKSTKRALLMSVLALLLCISMLIGTTYAWFTDTVTSAGNKIVAGTLDVKLLMHNGTDYVDISNSDKPIFGEGSLAQNNAAETLWEPGKTQIVYLAVENAGSLALKYNILVDVIDNGLAGALKYAILDGATKADVDAYGADCWDDILAVSGVQTGDVVSGRTIAAENGGIAPYEFDYFALAVHMDELAGNDYQGKDVVIDIELLATQLAYEEDSFDNTYDADAPLDSTEGMVAYIGSRYFPSINEAVKAAKAGDTIGLVSGYNTQNDQLTETIVIDKEVTLTPNGMYLVSSAPATFTVEEGGKLTVDEGSFTIRNTAANGACVLVDGGEFVMAGGSFVGHTAMRTTEGNSSTVTLAAGWSNGVTVGIDSNGDDEINITGGTLISSQESIIADGKTTINMSGGTLSGKPARQNQYNPSVVCNGETTINMTGGKIETTANQSVAVCANNNSVINLSGDAVISGTSSAIRFGDFAGRNPGDNNELNISGNAKVTANGAGNNWKIGYAIQANATNTVINVSENATVDGSSYGVYAGFEGCAVTISDNATIKATSGSEGIGVGAPSITVTGGNITAKNYGVISDFAGSTVVIDNSVTKTPITISGGTYDVYIHSTSNYTVGGDPVFDTFGTRQ